MTPQDELLQLCEESISYFGRSLGAKDWRDRLAAIKAEIERKGMSDKKPKKKTKGVAIEGLEELLDKLGLSQVEGLIERMEELADLVSNHPLPWKVELDQELGAEGDMIIQDREGATVDFELICDAINRLAD